MQISAQKKAKITQELEHEAGSWQHKERFGLFSYLPHHGFGARDENINEATGEGVKKVIKVVPKNFQGGRPNSAVLGIKGFSKPVFLSSNDQYVDPASIMKFRDSNKDKIKEVHGKAFKPSHNGPKVIKAPYAYQSDNMDGDQAGPGGAGRKRGNSSANGPNGGLSFNVEEMEGDQAGPGGAGRKRGNSNANGNGSFNVEGMEGDQAGQYGGRNSKSQSKLKNFGTSPAKKGYGATTYGHLFSHPKYMPDPYEYPNTVSSMERAKHRSKFLEGPFQLTYKKRDHFTPNYKEYRVPGGKSGYRPQTAGPTFVPPFLRANLPKQGYNKTINRFPEYVEERTDDKQGEFGKRPETAREGIWRYNHKELSRPDASINNYNARFNISQPRQKF